MLVIAQLSKSDFSTFGIKERNIKGFFPCINSYALDIDEIMAERFRKSTVSFCTDTHITAQMNSVRKIVGAEKAQQKGYYGDGICTAVLDTGITPSADFTLPVNRIIKFVDFVNFKDYPYDDNGHGTHVSGILGGNGILSDGLYRGIAPHCEIISLKVLDKDGRGNMTNVIAGIQWLIDNKKKYNIRIANLSIGTETTIGDDPLVKAVESAWDSGIVFVVAGGNNGPSKMSITSPGTSRKAITVGAYDDNGKKNFSGRGPTRDCIIKPDVVAPGKGIMSCTENGYARLSGTSMSTPVVSGAVALLLQKYPHLQPDDVKLMIKKSCIDLHRQHNRQGWGLIDIDNLINGGVYYAR